MNNIEINVDILKFYENTNLTLMIDTYTYHPTIYKCLYSIELGNLLTIFHSGTIEYYFNQHSYSEKEMLQIINMIVFT